MQEILLFGQVLLVEQKRFSSLKKNIDINEICDRLKKGQERGKRHSIIVVAEGVASGIEIGKQIKANMTNLIHVFPCLGHIQRGDHQQPLTVC